MRELNFSIPSANKASVGITTALYDRRALDCTSTLPLINSLNHLAYLTTSSARIREILTIDGGVERLICILKEGRSKDDIMDTWKWNLAFQCIVNIGVRGSESVRTRLVEADTVPVIATILDNFMQVVEKLKQRHEVLDVKRDSTRHKRFAHSEVLDTSTVAAAATAAGIPAGGPTAQQQQHRRRHVPPPVHVPRPDAALPTPSRDTPRSGSADDIRRSHAAPAHHHHHHHHHHQQALEELQAQNSDVLSASATAQQMSHMHTRHASTSSHLQHHHHHPHHHHRPRPDSSSPPAGAGHQRALTVSGPTPLTTPTPRAIPDDDSLTLPDASNADAISRPDSPATPTAPTPRYPSAGTDTAADRSPRMAAGLLRPSIRTSDSDEDVQADLVLAADVAAAGTAPVAPTIEPMVGIQNDMDDQEMADRAAMMEAVGDDGRRLSVNGTAPDGSPDASDRFNMVHRSIHGTALMTAAAAAAAAAVVEANDALAAANAEVTATRAPTIGALRAAAAAPDALPGPGPAAATMTTAAEPSPPPERQPWTAWNERYMHSRAAGAAAASPVRDEDVLLSLQLLAYISKYCNLRDYFQATHLVPKLKIGKELALFASGTGAGAGVGAAATAAGPGGDVLGAGADAPAAASLFEGEAEKSGLQQHEQSNSQSQAQSQAQRMDECADDEADADNENEYLQPDDYNIFPLVEKFTVRYHTEEMRYWAGVTMRNLCRKDRTQGGIRQCAYYQCGKWEAWPRQFAKCRRCRQTKYCSKECQKLAWVYHRHWCITAST